MNLRLLSGQPGKFTGKQRAASCRGSESASEEVVRGWRAAAIRRLKMYPEEFVQPMREELTRIGFQELRTPEQVDSTLGNEKRTTLVVVNSICGCAAGKARPAIAK